MTLNELKDLCDELIEEGYGKSLVIKASDDEGNSYLKVGTIQQDKALMEDNNYRGSVVAEEDYEDYDGELTDVICVW